MVTRIGEHFEIADMDADMLGIGGMGTVYVGTDTRTGETVAIKELKSEVMLDNPEMLERFEREADALRMLDHPNIVKVLASFADGNHHYIVMDYVSGGSLRELLDDQRQMPIERVLEISLDLADALTRAHRLKIIHRDIKPANVLIAEDGTPRLTDFGVARIDEKTRMTETGMVVGTLSYLSPESLDGQRPDERQDIWAFGVMLFEMVSGERPFDGDTASSVITGILTKDTPDLTDLRPDVPPELKRLIEWMLRKNPDERIGSIRRVGTEIENIIRGVDSDEYAFDDEVMQSIKEADHSRFESDSDELESPVSTFSNAQPATKYGIPMHTGVTVVQDESGQDMIMMPANVALKGRKVMQVVFLLLVLIIVGLLVFMNRNMFDSQTVAEAIPTEESAVPPDTFRVTTPDTLAQRVEAMSRVASDDFVVMLVLAVEDPDDTANIADEYEPIVLDFMQTLENDIPFAEVRTELIRFTGGNMPVVMNGFYGSVADVMVWLEIEDEGIRAVIQGGNPAKMAETPFAPQPDDEDVVGRTLLVETLVTDADTQTIIPYVLGILNLQHTLSGDIFEFMRNFAVLEEVDKAPAQLVTGGIMQHYFNFFNQFLSDTPAAIDAMSAAIDLDGGNPLWYALRGTGYMRLNQSDQSVRDAKTAERIGPEGWAIPLVIQATGQENYGEDIEALNTALDYREDWFIYYLRATFYYAAGNLDAAGEDVSASLNNNPQANYPYVTGFLVAMRQGQVADAGQILAEMVKEHPDPRLGNRVYEATFGENNTDVLISGKLYEGFGNIVIGQYEPVIAFEPELMVLMTQFNDLMEMLRLDADIEGYRYFPGDVMMMMGLSYCALEDYDKAMTWLSQGLTIDPDSVLLRYIRTEVSSQLGNEDLVQEDVVVIEGITEELDSLIDAGRNQEITCDDFFDYFVNLGDESA